MKCMSLSMFPFLTNSKHRGLARRNKHKMIKVGERFNRIDGGLTLFPDGSSKKHVTSISFEMLP